jgi:hypothetical protein
MNEDSQRRKPTLAREAQGLQSLGVELNGVEPLVHRAALQAAVKRLINIAPVGGERGHTLRIGTVEAAPLNGFDGLSKLLQIAAHAASLPSKTHPLDRYLLG